MVSVTESKVYWKKIKIKNRQVEETQRARCRRKSSQLPCPLLLSQHLVPRNLTQHGRCPKLGSSGFFTEARLHRHDWLIHWPLAIDSTSSCSHLPGLELGLQAPALSSHGWDFQTPISLPRWTPKVGPFHLTKTHFSYYSGNSKGFLELYARNGDEDPTCISSCKS